MEEVHLVISGRVQGIRFRKTVAEYAHRKEIYGHVENQEDGSVAVVAQQDKETLQTFILWLKQSPGFSQVTDVNESWHDVKEQLGSFEIKIADSFIKDKASAFKNLGRAFFRQEVTAVPRHVAIIPDGNRRWAKARNLEGKEGHRAAAEYGRLKKFLREVESLKIKYISLWLFSSENWKRSRDEITSLFTLIEELIHKLRKDKELTARFTHIGRKDRIPKHLAKLIAEFEEETRNEPGVHLQLCIDYGGRDEILRAATKAVQAGEKEITDEILRKYLDTKNFPDPDLIIRTSGEQRLSGFFSYQGAYAELYFVQKHFPDFTPADLRAAVVDFGKRKRRYGGN